MISSLKNEPKFDPHYWYILVIGGSPDEGVAGCGETGDRSDNRPLFAHGCVRD